VPPAHLAHDENSHRFPDAVYSKHFRKTFPSTFFSDCHSDVISALESRKPKVSLKFLEGLPLLGRVIHHKLHEPTVVRLEHATVRTAPDVLYRERPTGPDLLDDPTNSIQVHIFLFTI